MSRAPSADRRRRGSCPVCGKPPADGQAPFCGQGCRDRDLLNWLGDAYRVPGPPADRFPAGEGNGLDSDA